VEKNLDLLELGLKKFRKYRHVDFILAFSVALAFGMLLALSASAQSLPEDFSSRNPFSEDLSSFNQPEILNQPPRLIDFGPDPSSPQEAGTSVRWSARAMDPENDPVYYLFWLNGPSTGGVWKKMTSEWVESQSWRWETSMDDVGASQVRVWVRDGKHADENGFDDSGLQDYFITSAQTEEPSFPRPSPQEQQISQIPAAIPVIETAATPAPPEEVNELPVLERLSASPNSPQEAGAVVTWMAEASDPEGDQLLFSFLLNGRTVQDWSAANAWNWDTTSARPGNYQIEVRIIDGNHARQQSYDDVLNAEFTILAPNRKPSLTGFGPDRSSPQESGIPVTWTAQAEDSDGDPLLYKFFLNGQPVADWSGSGEWTWDTAVAPAGNYQAEVWVRDDRHAGPDSFDDSRTAQFAIAAPNQVPALISFGPDKSSPQETGTAVTWTAEASDPEGDRILYRFFLNGQPVDDWTTKNQWTWKTAAGDVGESQVEVQIIDGRHSGPEGFDDRREAGFAITAPNQKPALLDLSADQSSPQEAGAAITWTAEASDFEGDQLYYRFFLNGQAVAEWSESNEWIWNTAAAPAGNYQVEVQVRDGKHAGPESFDDSRTAQFAIVAPNQVPALISFSPDKASPQDAGTTVIWSAEAADPEGDSILYRFFLNGQPVGDWTAENQWKWDAAQAGEYQVEVQVRDGKHAGPESFDDSSTESFIISAIAPEEAEPEVVAAVNQTPAVVSLSPDPTGPQEIGSIVTWTASASDPENDPVLYQFLLNGSPVTAWTVNNSWPWNPSQAGTSQIEVRVRDGQHAGEDGFDSNMVAEYTITAPVTEEVPEEVLETPEPETEIPPAQENVTLPVTPQPENITIPENVTAPIAPSPAVEENQAPVLNLLIPNKASPQPPGTSVIWTANATDPEEDLILYRFFLSGPATGGSWQAETSWSSENSWTWDTTSQDAGENQVRVWIRDAKHASEDSFDAEQVAFFSIVAPAKNISGTKWNDLNGNGVRDNNEPGLSSWTISLKKPDGSEVSTLTKEDGSYRFESLPEGTYAVSEMQQSRWTATAPASGSQTVQLSDSDLNGIDFGNRLETYSISGMKFNDLNENGANDGEPGLSGWTVKLSKDGSEVGSAVTANDGSYRFEDLQAGSYEVSEVGQSGWVRTAPASGSHRVDIKDADITGLDFGNHGSWSVSGTKFHDLNGNGAQDGDEVGLPGWTVQLKRDGSVINATTTAQDGSYTFRNLAPGSYSVAEVLQDGWVQTSPASGSHIIEIKDADISGLDFGNRANLSLSGVKFYDANGNGVQDEDEPGLPGQEVKLAKDGREIASTTTAQDGSYTFTNLAPGTYEVDDPILVTVTTSSKVVVNIPAIGPYKISGVKFNDLNNNGIKDSGEPGVANWGIDLVLVVPGPDLLLAQTHTDANGAYTFGNIFPGTYKVSELAKQGWTPTTPTEITVSVTNSNKPNQNFGNRLVTPPTKASIFGLKFNDWNGNGARDPGEPGLSGWTIELKHASNLTLAATATTAADGTYSFLNLTPSTYVVGEVVQSGWTQTKPAVGPGGQVYSFTLSPGENKLGIDFGNRNNNLPPTNPKLVPNKASPQKVGTPITWTASATDPEGDPLEFRFIVRGPSSSVVRADTGYSSNNVWTWSTVGYQPGKYNIEVLIRDGYNPDVKAEVKNYQLTSPNLPPVVNTLFADRPAPQYAGSWIKWTALASDPEGDPLQYRFFLRGPATGGFWIDQTGWGKNPQWVWRTTPLDIGYSEILVAVRDGKHAGPGGSDDHAIGSYFIISMNQPPRITSLSANLPSPQPIGVTARWTATAFDPDGDLVFYRYWLRGPSTGGLWKLVRDWSTDPTWTWPTSPADVGTSEVQVQVRDGHHASPSGWDDDAGALFTVLRPNLPPKLTALNPDKPSPQYAGTPVKFGAIAADPDGDPVLYRFWLKGPSTGNAWKVVQDWSYASFWTWNNAAADAGAYTVYVYARDGKHAGTGGYDSAMGASYVLLTAPNLAPKLTSLNPDKPSPQMAGTLIRWTATASDPDKDAMLYRFWLKGPSTKGAWKIVQDWSAKNQWTWASTPADIGDNTVYVYVRDGKHAGTGGYDSAVGQTYRLLDPLAARMITSGSAIKDKPSLLFTGDGFLMAYQSWEQGSGNQGDIALQKFDPAWSKLKNLWVSSAKAYEDSPSLIYSQGYYYLAYVSAEKGSRDIFVKKYDGLLNLVDTKQLTSSPTNQDSPSLIAAGGDFYLAYQSWDTGSDSGGDLFITRFDPNWKALMTVQATDQKSYQDRPSLAFAGGNFYLAYVSRETGNSDIFLQKFDGALNFLEKKRLTVDSSDQDFPRLKWLNGQFMLLYATKKAGNYDLVLERFLQDWKPVDSTTVVAGPGDQTASSMTYSNLDGMYWVTYASKDSQGQNIFTKPLKLALPAGLKSCDIALSFSSTKAGSPYVLTARFYNNYGQLTDPTDLALSWSPQDAARSGDKLKRASAGTYQLASVFGAPGDKSFRLSANIDGCIAVKTANVKAA